MTAQQLKNSILQMAVQGKLVPQDPNDEPASVLLQRIKAEKQELIKAGKIKKDKKSSEIFRGATHNLPYAYCEQIGKEIRDISDEIPFEIPESWEWVRLGSICQLVDGEKLVGIQYNNLDARYMRGKGESKVLDNGKYVDKGTRLILVDGENSGEVFIAPENGYMGSTFKILWITPSLFASYILHFIEIHRMKLKNSKKGAAIPHLNKDLFFDLLLPLPPLAEQHRIVAKIEELLPYIERYGKAEEHLTALNTTFPEALKKSILQEAVQGKLVPQNPDDEPASVLLERIRAEKQALVKAGKIKKDKHESVIITRDKIPYEIIDGKERCIADEVPFEIPDSWEWVRLGIISTYNQTKKKINAKDADISIWGLDLEDIEKGGRLLVKKTVGERKAVGDKTVFTKGDILYSKLRPYLLKILVAPDSGICTPEIVPFTVYGGISAEYIVNFLKSPYVDGLVNGETYGIKMPRAGTDTMISLLVPLPPLSEQHRIVAKIEEIMPYINSIT